MKQQHNQAHEDSVDSEQSFPVHRRKESSPAPLNGGLGEGYSSLPSLSPEERAMSFDYPRHLVQLGMKAFIPLRDSDPGIGSLGVALSRGSNHVALYDRWLDRDDKSSFELSSQFRLRVDGQLIAAEPYLLRGERPERGLDQRSLVEKGFRAIAEVETGSLVQIEELTRHNEFETRYEFLVV